MPRHHTDAPLDPHVAAELERLEAALAGTPSADPDLLALTAAVREDPPPPDAAFRARLDSRVAAGFRTSPGLRARLAAAGTFLGDHRRVAMPALGLAATMLIALVVAVGTLRDDQGTPVSGALAVSSAENEAAEPFRDPATTPGAAAQAAPAASSDAGGSSIAPLPPEAPRSALPTPPVTVPGRDRRVERSTQLALRTSAGRLQTVADGVVRVTQSAGGVVEQSSVDGTDRGGSADFTLTVPTARADDVLTRLSRLAHVTSTRQASTDITAAFVSSAERLSDARAERRALLKALDAARTPDGIARLRERLRANRNEIAGLNAERDRLRTRASTTTMAVTVLAAGPGDEDEGSGGGWSPGDAAGDALRVLEVAAGVLIVSLAVAVPLLLIAVPALMGARVARRRRREHALDGA